MERPQAMTALKPARREILFRLRPVQPANLILALFVLFVLQLVFYAFWAWLVERFAGAFGDTIQPAIASVSCSLTAFFTIIHSRPVGGRQGFVACAAACLSALAVAGGFALAAMAARAVFPEYGDGFPVRMFVVFIGFWAGAPVMFSAALRLGMRPVDDKDKRTWP